MFRFVKNGTVQTDTERKIVTIDCGDPFSMPVVGPLADATLPIPHKFSASREDLENQLPPTAPRRKDWALISASLEGPQSMRVYAASTLKCIADDLGANSSVATLAGPLVVQADGDSRKPTTVLAKVRHFGA